MSTPTPLEQALRALIAAEGPITVARYMALCLTHPRHGYYVTRDPFGSSGDFTTAPEISQMFGELLGLWGAAVWERMGSPNAVHLVELGPGRGTLMADALRAAKVMPAFHSAISVHLVEVSEALRTRQRAALATTDRPLAWYDDVAKLPEGPMVILANEFFDALPVHQAVRSAAGWHERRVGLGPDGALAFGFDPAPLPGFEARLPAKLRNAQPGAVFEWREDGSLPPICQRLRSHGGALLTLDYGHAESGLGDTLQAVRRHAFIDPLSAPGESDLTAHVDFSALAAVGTRFGLRAQGPVEQGAFLDRLGIRARAERLCRSASASQRAAIDGAVERLTGASQMGRLFKVLALAGPALGPALGALPGFDS